MIKIKQDKSPFNILWGYVIYNQEGSVNPQVEMTSSTSVFTMILLGRLCIKRPDKGVMMHIIGENFTKSIRSQKL